MLSYIKVKEPTDGDFEVYEELPTNNIFVYMLAGAMAGTAEHCVMYPMDSIKTRMQSLRGPESTVLSTFKSMVQSEGIFRPVRGMGVLLLGAGPAHAIYFTVYEQLKRGLITPGREISVRNYLAYGLCASIATFFHDAIMTPADAIKQRMQMYNSPYTSIFDCAKKMYAAEGRLGFYRSYTTQLSMNLPFQLINFWVYEIMHAKFNRKRAYNPPVHMCAGAVSGGLAAAVTTPMDVIKTLLNTQEPNALKALGKSHITGVPNAMKAIYKLNGILGFFKGITARVLFHIPSASICWSVYEFFKYALERQKEQEMHHYRRNRPS